MFFFGPNDSLAGGFKHFGSCFPYDPWDDCIFTYMKTIKINQHILGGGFYCIFYVHPETWGNLSILTTVIFFNGVGSTTNQLSSSKLGYSLPETNKKYVEKRLFEARNDFFQRDNDMVDFRN